MGGKKKQLPKANVLLQTVLWHLTRNCRGCSRLLFKTVLFIILDVNTAVNAYRIRFRVLLGLESVDPVQMRVLFPSISDSFGLTAIRGSDGPPQCRKEEKDKERCSHPAP